MEKKNNYVSFADLYNGMGLPKKVKSVMLWQDEAANAVKYFIDGQQFAGSIFKAFRDDNQKAKIAFSDTKELGRQSALYFLKVYSELKKNNKIFNLKK